VAARGQEIRELGAERPVEKLVNRRTSSSGSEVGPAVTTQFMEARINQAVSQLNEEIREPPGISIPDRTRAWFLFSLFPSFMAALRP